MCFSESASFSASGILAVMSILSLSAAKKHPKYLALALIPLFFSIQQFSEGVQWHLFNEGMAASPLMWGARSIYVFFAYILWPFWIPFSLYKVEEIPTRANYLKILSILGGLLSLYNLYQVIFFPVEAAVIDKSIQYTSGIPHNEVWAYLFITLAPWFISSLQGTTSVGIVIAASIAISSYFYYDVFTSVWCFFSALISGLVVIVLNFPERMRGRY